jgi:hypothetical protein
MPGRQLWLRSAQTLEWADMHGLALWALQADLLRSSADSKDQEFYLSSGAI